MISIADLRADPSPTITVQTAAEALAVDPRTLRLAINEGDIPAIRIGRRIVIPREKFLALFEVA